MQCSKCGASINENHKFCPSCGEKIPESLALAEEKKDLPPKKPMPFWFKLLLFIAFVALILVSAGILFTERLVDVVDKQLEALRSGNIDAAYQDYTSKDFKNATTLEQFRQFIDTYPILINNHSAQFPQRSIKDHITILKGKLMANDQTTAPVEYRLIKEDGKWKILSVRILKVQSQNSDEKRDLIKLTKAQLKDIQEGNVKQAYDKYTSQEFKQATSLEGFENFLKKYPILVNRHLTSFHNPLIQDHTGRLSIILRSDQYVAYLKNYYVYEDGAWKILSMRILSPSEFDEQLEPAEPTKSKDMEINSITLGDKADDQGMIINPDNHFEESLKDLYMNISIQNGVKGTPLSLILRQVESGSSISSKITLEEDGDTLLTSIFSPPAGGWLPGHYQILVSSPTGLKQAIDFEIG